MFPHIETLDDVTPHISYDNGIVVSKRDGYTVVDYVFVNNDTFANDIARECRGAEIRRRRQFDCAAFSQVL